MNLGEILIDMKAWLNQYNTGVAGEENMMLLLTFEVILRHGIQLVDQVLAL